jgi:hypothetical protein
MLMSHIDAYQWEHATGIFGAPGSVWYIAADGTAQTSGPCIKELAIAISNSDNVVLFLPRRPAIPRAENETGLSRRK